ncbi:MAG: hypothetical protein PHS14_00140 [Elusimicrobia bacterium]|nr:hypothetical protein [Elusimicrobiota bacterium]
MKRKKGAKAVAPAQEHVLVDLKVTTATCSCSAQFLLSDTVVANLSPSRCQDELLDLFHTHLADMRGAAGAQPHKEP